jgi:hypothetical protein
VTAAEVYAARVDAVDAQAARLRARVQAAAESGVAEDGTDTPPRRPPVAPDPRRALDPELALLASYLEQADVLVDVGGGSGRLGLPLAQRCREVINVDPSADALAAFTTAAAEAGIANVKAVPGDWLTVTGVEGDVVLAAHVTYVVRNIVPFVERLQATARRRVIVLLYSTPPAGQAVHQKVFRLLHGEAAAVPPSYRELLPVLWEMGILPDVRVVPEVGVRRVAPTREAAIALSLALGAPAGVPAGWKEQARRTLAAHFDELFRPVDGGFRPAGTEDHRGTLITWEP